MDRKDGKEDGKVGDIPLTDLYYEGGTKVKPFRRKNQSNDQEEEKADSSKVFKKKRKSGARKDVSEHGQDDQNSQKGDKQK